MSLARLVPSGLNSNSACRSPHANQLHQHFLLTSRVHAGRVVVFDTETTGGTACDEICQIAAVEFMGGTFARMMSVNARPTCPEPMISEWAKWNGTNGVS